MVSEPAAAGTINAAMRSASADAQGASVPEHVMGTPTIVGVPAQCNNKHQDVRGAFNYQYSVASAWWQQWYQWYARHHSASETFQPLGAVPAAHVMRSGGPPAQVLKQASAPAAVGADAAPPLPELRTSGDAARSSLDARATPPDGHVAVKVQYAQPASDGDMPAQQVHDPPDAVKGEGHNAMPDEAGILGDNDSDAMKVCSLVLTTACSAVRFAVAWVMCAVLWLLQCSLLTCATNPTRSSAEMQELRDGLHTVLAH